MVTIVAPILSPFTGKPTKKQAHIGSVTRCRPILLDYDNNHRESMIISVHVTLKSFHKPFKNRNQHQYLFMHAYSTTAITCNEILFISKNKPYNTIKKRYYIKPLKKYCITIIILRNDGNRQLRRGKFYHPHATIATQIWIAKRLVVATSAHKQE